MDGQQNTPQRPDEPTWQFTPGDTISPRPENQQAAQPAQTPPQSVEQPAATATPAPMTQSPPEPVTTTAIASPSNSLPPETPQAPVDVPYTPEVAPVAYWQGEPAQDVSWTASEYIAHHKTAGWYVLLNVGAILVAILVWLVTKDYVSAVVVVLAGIVLSAYGARKPRELEYHLDGDGLDIAEKHYSFSNYRSFSVMNEGAFSSIVLLPMKRFAPMATLYFDPQDEDRIIDLISKRLPHEERSPDLVDSLMRHIRF